MDTEQTWEAERNPLLRVHNLTIEVRAGGARYAAVNGLSFMVGENETVAIVGESGSGKSLTAQAIMGILPGETTRLVEGEMFFGATRIGGVGFRTPRRIRGTEMAMVFQDPLSSLNPLVPVGKQIAEMYRERAGYTRRAARAATLEIMAQVGLPDPARRFEQYPHELSGGLRQRVMIAMALSLKPRLLIADEPTTALDVTIQAQIMDLIMGLKDEHGLGLLLITHDLALAAETADNIVVMYAGKVMELGALVDVFERPAHPYTASLLHAVPNEYSDSRSLYSIPGSPPDSTHRVGGCPFHPRCYMATRRCVESVPALDPVTTWGGGIGTTAPGRYSACHYRDSVGPVPDDGGSVAGD